MVLVVPPGRLRVAGGDFGIAEVEVLLVPRVLDDGGVAVPRAVGVHGRELEPLGALDAVVVADGPVVVPALGARGVALAPLDDVARLVLVARLDAVPRLVHVKVRPVVVVVKVRVVHVVVVLVVLAPLPVVAQGRVVRVELELLALVPVVVVAVPVRVPQRVAPRVVLRVDELVLRAPVGALLRAHRGPAPALVVQAVRHRDARVLGDVKALARRLATRRARVPVVVVVVVAIVARVEVLVPPRVPPRVGPLVVLRVHEVDVLVVRGARVAAHRGPAPPVVPRAVVHRVAVLLRLVEALARELATGCARVPVVAAVLRLPVLVLHRAVVLAPVVVAPDVVHGVREDEGVAHGRLAGERGVGVDRARLRADQRPAPALVPAAVRLGAALRLGEAAALAVHLAPARARVPVVELLGEGAVRLDDDGVGVHRRLRRDAEDAILGVRDGVLHVVALAARAEVRLARVRARGVRVAPLRAEVAGEVVPRAAELEAERVGARLAIRLREAGRELLRVGGGRQRRGIGVVRDGLVLQHARRLAPGFARALVRAVRRRALVRRGLEVVAEVLLVRGDVVAPGVGAQLVLDAADDDAALGRGAEIQARLLVRHLVRHRHGHVARLEARQLLVRALVEGVVAALVLLRARRLARGEVGVDGEGDGVRVIRGRLRLGRGPRGLRHEGLELRLWVRGEDVLHVGILGLEHLSGGAPSLARRLVRAVRRRALVRRGLEGVAEVLLVRGDVVAPGVGAQLVLDAADDDAALGRGAEIQARLLVRHLVRHRHGHVARLEARQLLVRALVEGVVAALVLRRAHLLAVVERGQARVHALGVALLPALVVRVVVARLAKRPADALVRLGALRLRRRRRGDGLRRGGELHLALAFDVVVVERRAGLAPLLAPVRGRAVRRRARVRRGLERVAEGALVRGDVVARDARGIQRAVDGVLALRLGAVVEALLLGDARLDHHARLQAGELLVRALGEVVVVAALVLVRARLLARREINRRLVRRVHEGGRRHRARHGRGDGDVMVVAKGLALLPANLVVLGVAPDGVVRGGPVRVGGVAAKVLRRDDRLAAEIVIRGVVVVLVRGLRGPPLARLTGLAHGLLAAVPGAVALELVRAGGGLHGVHRVRGRAPALLGLALERVAAHPLVVARRRLEVAVGAEDDVVARRERGLERRVRAVVEVPAAVDDVAAVALARLVLERAKVIRGERVAVIPPRLGVGGVAPDGVAAVRVAAEVLRILHRLAVVDELRVRAHVRVRGLVDPLLARVPAARLRLAPDVPVAGFAVQRLVARVRVGERRLGRRRRVLTPGLRHEVLEVRHATLVGGVVVVAIVHVADEGENLGGELLRLIRVGRVQFPELVNLALVRNLVLVARGHLPFQLVHLDVEHLAVLDARVQAALEVLDARVGVDADALRRREVVVEVLNGVFGHLLHRLVGGHDELSLPRVDLGRVLAHVQVAVGLGDALVELLHLLVQGVDAEVELVLLLALLLEPRLELPVLILELRDDLVLARRVRERGGRAALVRHQVQLARRGRVLVHGQDRLLELGILDLLLRHLLGHLLHLQLERGDVVVVLGLRGVRLRELVELAHGVVLLAVARELRGGGVRGGAERERRAERAERARGEAAHRAERPDRGEAAEARRDDAVLHAAPVVALATARQGRRVVHHGRGGRVHRGDPIGREGRDYPRLLGFSDERATT